MGRTKRSNEPTKMNEPTVEEYKNEKSTDSKTPADFEEDVGSEYKLEDIIGIGPKTAEKLRSLGYTFMGIATGRADEISQEMKVAYPQAKAWCSAAQEKLLAKMVLKPSTEVDKEKKAKQVFLKTGSKNFNDFLGGGIPTTAITGLTGRFASGKTQICNDLVIDCLSRLKEKAVYIETEPDTFHLDRLKQMAMLKKVECNWEDLYVCEASQIPTAKAQFLQYKIIQKALERGEKIRLVVIDSFNAKFRGGWSRSEMLPLRTREFGEHFNLLEYLASRYNIAFVLTCQTIAPPRPDQGLGAMVKFGDTFYPVGGDYLLHSVNNWIGLSQVKTDVWKATLFDSSYLPRGTKEFLITPKGIEDSVE